MNRPIFRESAIERLASPEQLDQVMRVTSVKSWLALVGVLSLVAVALAWGFLGRIPVEVQAQGIVLSREALREVVAGQDGEVAALNVKAGDAVRAGQVVARLKTAASTEVDLTAPFDGTVLEVLAQPGMVVERGANVAILQPATTDLQAIVYLPLTEASRVRPGMTVYLSPVTTRAQETGFLVGRVAEVGAFPVSQRGLALRLKNDKLVQWFSAPGPTVEVTVTLLADPNTPSGFQWSSPRGAETAPSSGTLAGATVVLAEKTPIALIFPSLGSTRP